MIIEERKEYFNLYVAYGTQVSGQLAKYEFTYTDGRIIDVINNIRFIEIGTGNIIYEYIAGNRWTSMETFERCVDNFLYWISRENPDTFTIDKMFWKIFIENLGSLFNTRMERAKLEEQRKRDEQEKFLESERLKMEIKKQCERSGLYLFCPSYGHFVILEFDSLKEKEYFLAADAEHKKMYYEYAKEHPEIKIKIRFDKECGAGMTGGKWWCNPADLTEVLKDINKLSAK